MTTRNHENNSLTILIGVTLRSLLSNAKTLEKISLKFLIFLQDRGLTLEQIESSESDSYRTTIDQHTARVSQLL